MMQAFRRLLCDLLLACKSSPRQALPILVAAIDVWPAALPPAEPSDPERLWTAAADTGGRDHSDCGVAVTHALLHRLFLQFNPPVRFVGCAGPNAEDCSSHIYCCDP